MARERQSCDLKIVEERKRSYLHDTVEDDDEREQRREEDRCGHGRRRERRDGCMVMWDQHDLDLPSRDEPLTLRERREVDLKENKHEVRAVGLGEQPSSRTESRGEADSLASPVRRVGESDGPAAEARKS